MAISRKSKFTDGWVEQVVQQSACPVVIVPHKR